MSDHHDSNRAERAYEQVHKRSREKEWSKYRTIALKLPVMVHNEGVLSALHFVAARSSPVQKGILDDLAEDMNHNNGPQLLEFLRGRDAEELRHEQREIARRLSWYKRVAQAIGKDPSEEPGVR